MPFPELAVIAEGELPTGERWTVRAGGTPEDYYTLLRTVHPGGHSDEGGMGGPLLYAGRSLNTYIGQADGGLFRVLARTATPVRRLQLKLDSGEVRELQPVATDAALGVNVFAALLPPGAGLVSLTGLDSGGQVVAD
jgi:hypothetical protein